MKKVEISMKEILVYVLRRWKPIVGFALILAILLGGYSYSQGIPSTEEAIPNLAEPDIVESDQTTLLSLSIDLDLTGFEKYREYHDNIAKNDILVKLQARYLIVAQGAPLTEILSGIVPADYGDAQLDRLVKVENPSAGIINIAVSGADDVDSKMAAAAIYEYLSGRSESLSQSVSPHKLSILASSSSAVASESAPVPTAGDAKYISSALMGLLIGLVVGILAAAFFYLVALPVQIPEQIQRQLDVRYLGGVRRKKRLSLGDRLAGSLRLADEEQAMEIISANLREFSGNYKRILFTGTVPGGTIKAFADKMSMYSKDNEGFISYGADINKDADTIKKLADSDAVVLVERMDASKLRHVNEIRERIDMSGKEILGYVLY